MELVLLFSHMGLPKDILTDQGTPFTSKLMSDLCRLLQVKHLRTSVYHSQMNGLVERFNHPTHYAFCVICNLNRQWRKQSKATKVGGKGMHVIVVLWLNGGPAGLLILIWEVCDIEGGHNYNVWLCYLQSAMKWANNITGSKENCLGGPPYIVIVITVTYITFH